MRRTLECLEFEIVVGFFILRLIVFMQMDRLLLYCISCRYFLAFSYPDLVGTCYIPLGRRCAVSGFPFFLSWYEIAWVDELSCEFV